MLSLRFEAVMTFSPPLSLRDISPFAKGRERRDGSLESESASGKMFVRPPKLKTTRTITPLSPLCEGGDVAKRQRG